MSKEESGNVDRTKHNMAIYEMFRSYVEHEDDLTNNRITWMLAIHGFLYASYGFTIQKKLEVFDKINAIVATNPTVNFDNYMRTGQLRYVLVEIEVFLITIACVGLFISLFAGFSVRAAHRAIQNNKTLFENKFYPEQRHGVEKTVNLGDSTNELRVPTIVGGGNEHEVKFGDLTSKGLPAILATSWILALGVSIWYVSKIIQYLY